MTDEEIMQQALEALENFARFQRMMMDGPDVSDKLLAEDYAEAGFLQGAKTITALRLRLAQPEQEPVSLNDGRLTQYADGRIGVGTPQEPVQEPVQEPFCYLRQTSSDRNPPHGWAVHFCKKDGDVSVYTALPQRKPLTNDRVWLEYMQLWPFRPNEEPTLAKDILRFARAIEAAHGIKGGA